MWDRQWDGLCILLNSLLSARLIHSDTSLTHLEEQRPKRRTLQKNTSVLLICWPVRKPPKADKASDILLTIKATSRCSLLLQMSLWSVCICLCVCAEHMGEHRENGRTDWDAVWRSGLLCACPSEPYVRWGAPWRHLVNMILLLVRGGRATYVRLFWPPVYLFALTEQ